MTSALVTVALGPLIGWTLTPAVLTVIAMVPAAVVDVRERRLPNGVVMIAGVVLLVSAFVSVFVSAEVRSIVGSGAVRPDLVFGLLLGALFGALVMTAPIMLLHVASPGAMGFGDVKAALVLGAALGTVDWRVALIALMFAAGAGASVGLVLRARTIPFGPFLVAGAALALVASGALLDPHTIEVMA